MQSDKAIGHSHRVLVGLLSAFSHGSWYHAWALHYTLNDEWPLAEPFLGDPFGINLVPASAFVTAMFDDHHLVVMAPAMIAMHPVITMHMIVMPDHDGLGTCD